MRTISNKIFSPAIRIVVLMIITTGIAYPILVTAIGQTTMPYQSNGSQVVLNGKVVGSELISQSFNSTKFFQPRNSTGIPVNALKTLVDLDVARNRETNALVFAPDYINVLNLNIELVKQYPDVYAQEVSAKRVP